MATDKTYNKKLADLQQHVPFLEDLIQRLKNPIGKPREAQLSKMESLHAMITNTKIK